DLPTMHRSQAEGAGVEAFAHITRPEEAAVQFIGPLMIRAHQLGCRPLRGLTDDGAAMTTGIVERADLAVGAADDDDIIVTDLVRHVAPAFLQFAGRNGKEPLPIE